MWGAAAPAALLLAAGMAYLPESPRWLVLSGGGAPAAAAALRRLQGAACDEARLAAEVAGIEAAVLASPRPPAPGGGAFAGALCGWLGAFFLWLGAARAFNS
jgi:hypothetical protein